MGRRMRNGPSTGSLSTQPRSRASSTATSRIDAGDYDNDGHSELIFAKPGYNYDGYVLYDDDLRHPVEFGWSYH